MLYKIVNSFGLQVSFRVFRRKLLKIKFFVHNIFFIQISSLKYFFFINGLDQNKYLFMTYLCATFIFNIIKSRLQNVFFFI